MAVVETPELGELHQDLRHDGKKPNMFTVTRKENFSSGAGATGKGGGGWG